ncbi:unnamed protein product [Prorocentrum cordatum]|uniref:Uncharacterized protein n=1 Tax=Prorocentrum cordatum TaxID=2364126 RepID=A0ABN9XMT6_9DINO|nr:unnamed protein product [Polarella glacialis]
MAVAFRIVLALLPLLSGAIVVKEHPDSTDAKAVEQPQQVALIQQHAAIAAHSSGIPFIATSIQLSLTQIMQPVMEKLHALKEWITEQLTALDKGLNATYAMPSEALELFATKFSTIFVAVDEKLQPITSKLSAASPAIDGLNKVLQATGAPGVADKITEVMDAMSKKAQEYQKTLSSSIAVADGLKNLTKSDWHSAGPKIQELKARLDTGAAAIKAFGDAFQAKVEEALALLAGKLGVEASMFSPVSKAAGDGWQDLVGGSSMLAAGVVSSAQALPPQILEAAPEAKDNSGAAAASALGAFAAAAASLVL